jgi:hypothetical protein
VRVGVDELAMLERGQEGEGCPLERRCKSRVGNAEMQDVPATRGGNDNSKDWMKVNGDICSKR